MAGKHIFDKKFNAPNVWRIIDLNKIINMKKMISTTKPSDLIWDSNKESNILLYKTNNPFTLKLST